MTAKVDHYATLGVMPDAESVVIIGAYRALASLYHPDRWKGDLAEATRRMASINVAYGVLRESKSRKEYDDTRTSTHSNFEEKEEDKDAAFDAALDEQEENWQLVVSVFPDLALIRKRLAKIAHRLAFAYVTGLLDSKQFSRRAEIAVGMEKAFLQRYFGTNPEILMFASRLIEMGDKKAVMKLNRYVEVLGHGMDAAAVIRVIEKDLKWSPTPKTNSNFKAESNTSETDTAMMAEFNIKFDGSHYSFQGYRYEKLVDAINYARKRR